MSSNDDAHLLIQGGSNHGMTVPLSEVPVILGRGPDNDLDIDQETVSRRHALILKGQDGFDLRDLNSANGTYVNRGKIGQKEYRLRHGHRIRLGGSEVTLVFRQTGSSTVKMGTGTHSAGATGEEAQPVNMEETPGPTPADKESELLKLLESRKHTALGRDEIARQIWPDLTLGSLTNQEIDKTVARLRSRIEENPRAPVRLITAGEYGFLLV